MDDVIEQRFDRATGRAFFFNRTAGKTGWTREAVERPAVQGQHKTAGVQEHYDEKRGRHYYFNPATRKTGWRREDVVGLNPAPTPAATLPTGSGGGGGFYGDSLQSHSSSSSSSGGGGGGGGSGGGGSPAAATEEGDVVACVDAQKRTYYFNRRTGKSSWTRAGVAAPQAVAAPAAQGAHIERRIDPATSRPFYYNRVTRKTGWSVSEVQSTVAEAPPSAPEVHVRHTTRGAGAAPTASFGTAGSAAAAGSVPTASAAPTPLPPPAEQMERKPIRARRFSIASEQALDRLAECCEQLETVDTQVRGVETVLLTEKDAAASASLGGAAQAMASTAPIQQMKDLLAALNGSVEKLQCKDIDSVSTHDLASGKDEARQQRKALTRHADALVARIKKARGECTKPSAKDGEARQSYLFKQGYLSKLNRSGKQWNKRWFILSGCKLMYHDSDQTAYHADDKGDLAAAAPTSNKRVINLLPDTRLAKQKGSSAVRFQLVTKERTWELRADNSSDLATWVDSIKVSSAGSIAPADIQLRTPAHAPPLRACVCSPAACVCMAWQVNLSLVREETMTRNPAHSLR